MDIFKVIGEKKAVFLLSQLIMTSFYRRLGEKLGIQPGAEMVEAIKARGGEARLTVYPEAGHDSWTQTYENQEVYDWLLSHRRESE